ncbi:MAG TPA: sulfatase-like hydrolase/transferase [Nitriliruptorales bacterium]
MNILLLHSDQHRYDCVGVNGHPLVHTPNLDRLAAQGVNFSHAFTPCPICTPARASLLHGTWSFQHQAISIDATEAPRGPADGLPAFTRLLREAGWYLGYVGKWHLGPGTQPTDATYGFDDYVPEHAYERWRAERGIARALDAPDPGSDGWSTDAVLRFFAGKTDTHVGPEQARVAWTADRAIDLLARAADLGRPFFIRWDPSEPHLPNLPPEPHASMYPPESIEPWPSWGDMLADKPAIQAQQRRTWGVDGWTWRDWAPVVSRYLGEITLMDAQVGRILGALDDLHLADDTMVVYTTDHGDLCGGHGMMDKHYVMYDDVVRVPLIVRWPGRAAPGIVSDAFVTHGIDLAATFCEAAGVPIPDTFAGLSLVPLLEGEVSNGRSDMLSAYHGCQFGLYSQRMVRDRRFKYIWNATAEDELYDLDADRGELTNLARHRDHRDEAERLRTRLAEWLRQERDPLYAWAGRVQLPT